MTWHTNTTGGPMDRPQGPEVRRRAHTLELYRAADGWRWRRRASNHQIVSDSAEAYVERRDAIHGMHLANGDWRDCRLIDDADNLALTNDDIDDEEQS